MSLVDKFKNIALDKDECIIGFVEKDKIIELLNKTPINNEKMEALFVEIFDYTERDYSKNDMSHFIFVWKIFIEEYYENIQEKENYDYYKKFLTTNLLMDKFWDFYINKKTLLKKEWAGRFSKPVPINEIKALCKLFYDGYIEIDTITNILKTIIDKNKRKDGKNYGFHSEKSNFN